MIFYDLVLYVFLSIYIYLIGIYGIFLTRKNIIIILISIELILLAINMLFVIFSIYFDDFIGQLFSFFILTLAAAESALGLSIMIIYYRLRGFLDINYINLIKG
jgi:NADH-quinone oxidoreductase subunit K